MKKNRIAILYTGGQSLYGIESYLINLFKHQSKACELKLFSLGHWQLTDYFQQAAWPLRFFSQKRLSLNTIRQIGQSLRTDEIDLLVANGALANLYARIVSIFYRVPTLSIVHSQFEKEYHGLRKLFYLVNDRLWRPATKHYIAVSQFLKDNLIKSGLSSDKISVVYNGVDLALKPSKAVKKAKGTFLVGSLGRLESIKNFDLLITAFSFITNPKIRLVIAGDGSQRQYLASLIDKYQLGQRVQLLGYVEDATSFLQSLDLYVQVSAAEGFGLATAKAMLAEKPVLLAEMGGLKELISHEQSGFFLKSLEPQIIARTIEELAGQKEQLKAVARQAYKMAKLNFDAKKSAQNTFKVFQDLIGK